MSLVLDLLLAASLLLAAGRTLTTPALDRAVVYFIVFGLLMTLAWARLSAPDIALAEAAIGAGLTGALLLDSLGALAAGRRERTAWVGRFGSLAVLLVAAFGALVLIEAMGRLQDQPVRLAAQVSANMPLSGVAHPVTAVLLNFRGYDTLLEIAVLLLALLGLLSVRSENVAAASRADGEPVLMTMARMAAPIMVLTSVYLLWAGSHRPGGAFQSGAVLAAAAVLLHLAGVVRAWADPGSWMRAGFAAGFLVFLAVAAGLLAGARLLEYSPTAAGALIVLIEAGLTISLGLILAGLFLFLTGDRP